MSETGIVIFDKEQSLERAKNHSEIVVQLREHGILKKGTDFGVIPGSKKPSLLKPGAERLCSAFGLSPEFESIESIQTWDADAPLFHYRYKCILRHIDTGKVIATGIGSCNSMESKYRWRWLWPNEVTDIDTTGMATRKTKSGQTQYRSSNDDVFSIVNTIDKMAQKRALIAAVLIGCNASDHFTQDIEDMARFTSQDDDIVDAEFKDVKSAPAAPPAQSNGNKRWNEDAQQVTNFIAWCKKSMNEYQPDEMLQALNDALLTRVDKFKSMSQYPGDKEHAMHAIIAYESGYDVNAAQDAITRIIPDADIDNAYMGVKLAIKHHDKHIAF